LAKADRPLVIVESPAKARTIGKYLGDAYQIEASIGHVRDLPRGKKDLPEEYKKEEWAYLGINVTDNFNPIYVVPEGKRAQVKKLKDAIKNASELFLATDEDREGEAISWHLCELLKPKIPVRRLVFHEITKEAIQNALSKPRELNVQLVEAQETRRIVDRLFGYDVSPLLWRKFGKPGLSAGRVQSVAVRLLVNRERERMAFRSATYWDLIADFHTAKGEKLSAELITVDGKKLPSSRDFDSATGKITDPSLLLLGEAEARALAEKVKGGEFKVAKVEQKPYSTKPSPPFTTSTLQQEANRKLRFTARRTMQVAQSLYENGYVTYIRTDSTTLAKEAVDLARTIVRDQYGDEFLPKEPRVYQTKVKNAQEAHEAIRPAGELVLPQDLRAELNDDQFRLYDLIWKRTMASQMEDSRGRRIAVTISGAGFDFSVSGKTIDFPGYLRAYVEGSDDPEADLADQEVILPAVAAGDPLSCIQSEPKSHTTEPPSRFTEPKLTKTLEQLGIGRPSTYATIIDTILQRDYAFKKNGALVPTWTALAVVQLLETHLSHLVDYEFTARMEDDLDAISRGEAEHKAYLHKFYFGGEELGLKAQVQLQITQIDPRDAGKVPIGSDDKGAIHVRVGKFGAYLEQGEQRANIPVEMSPDELTVEKSAELLATAARGDEPMGNDPTTGLPVYLKQGRFGPYIQLGEQIEDSEEKPRRASLLKGMKPEDINLEVSLKLLSLPREVGLDPTSQEPIVAANGRFGPYLKKGTDNRSLPADVSPIDVTLEQALALFAQPKQARRGFGVKKPPLRVLGTSPVTTKEVQVLSGRFGPYVNDGTTNASLPAGTTPEEVTLDEALSLLAARAARGPVVKKTRKRAAKTPKTAKKSKKKPKEPQE
jgi:DNA topoisomerase I